MYVCMYMYIYFCGSSLDYTLTLDAIIVLTYI